MRKLSRSIYHIEASISLLASSNFHLYGKLSIPDDEDIGLLTREEMLKRLNPKGKHHPDDAYGKDSFYNTPLHRVATNNVMTRWEDKDYVLESDNNRKNFVISLSRKGYPDSVVAVVVNGKLYHTPITLPNEIPTDYRMGNGTLHLDVKKSVKVKYLDKFVALVNDVARRNREHFSVLVKNIIIDGEQMQVRAEKPLAKNKGIPIAVLDSHGYVVGSASNEWGATLIQVNKAYRRKGIGNIMGRIWYKWNPDWNSGGFTPQGESAAIARWEDRVRELSGAGVYSKMVRDGEVTLKRVQEIINGVSKRKPRLQRQKSSRNKKPELLVYNDGVTFVVYNKEFYKDQDDKWIYAHGFFRNDNSVPAPFLYSIDYDQGYRKLAVSIALQMSRDNGEGIYVGKGYGDLFEYHGIRGVVRDGDVIELTKNIFPSKSSAKLEHLYRKRNDKYDEVLTLLLEQADSKWK